MAGLYRDWLCTQRLPGESVIRLLDDRLLTTCSDVLLDRVLIDLGCFLLWRVVTKQNESGARSFQMSFGATRAVVNRQFRLSRHLKCSFNRVKRFIMTLQSHGKMTQMTLKSSSVTIGTKRKNVNERATSDRRVPNTLGGSKDAR
jgi:hypothetical protein